MFKKLLVSLLLVITVFTSVVPKTALAAAPTWYHSTFEDWLGKVNDPANPQDIYAERYTAAQVEWVIYGYFAWILNSIFGTDLALCLVRLNSSALAVSLMASCGPEIVEWIGDKLKSVMDLGALPQSENKTFLTKIFLDSRPISGIGYFREKASEFGIVSEASAASVGFGFEAAEPVKLLWQSARDVSYFFVILALVVMAFMIMFRVKTSPQAIITVQSALPKLIVGIVAITFSYAIAGLMIDLMYVVMGLVASILVSSEMFNITDWGTMYNELNITGFQTARMFSLYFSLFMVSFFTSIMGIISIFIGNIGGLIVPPVILIFTLIVMFKVAWSLFKNFITLLLLIAAGPLIIMGGVIGGGGFSGWLKNLASHLAVYPAVGAMFAFAFYFLTNSLTDLGEIVALIRTYIPGSNFEIPFNPKFDMLGGNSIAEPVWVPPMTGIAGIKSIWLLLSLVVVSLIPKVVEIISSALAGKPFAYGSAIGAPLAAGAGVVAAPFGFISQGWNAAQEQLGKGVWSKVSSEVMRRANK